MSILISTNQNILVNHIFPYNFPCVFPWFSPCFVWNPHFAALMCPRRLRTASVAEPAGTMTICGEASWPWHPWSSGPATLGKIHGKTMGKSLFILLFIGFQPSFWWDGGRTHQLIGVFSCYFNRLSTSFSHPFARLLPSTVDGSSHLVPR